MLICSYFNLAQSPPRLLGVVHLVSEFVLVGTTVVASSYPLVVAHARLAHDGRFSPLLCHYPHLSFLSIGLLHLNFLAVKCTRVNGHLPMFPVIARVAKISLMVGLGRIATNAHVVVSLTTGDLAIS
jgi:hypothetical protein